MLKQARGKGKGRGFLKGRGLNRAPGGDIATAGLVGHQSYHIRDQFRLGALPRLAQEEGRLPHDIKLGRHLLEERLVARRQKDELALLRGHLASCTMRTNV